MRYQTILIHHEFYNTFKPCDYCEMRFRICNSSFNDGTKRFNTADLWAAFPFASFATKPPPPLPSQFKSLSYASSYYAVIQ